MKQSELDAGKDFLKRVADANHKAETAENVHKREVSSELIDGTVKCIENKIAIKQHEMTLERHQHDADDAYNARAHLIKVKEDLVRQKNLQ